MRRLDSVLSDLIARRRSNGPDQLIASLRRRLAGEPEVVVLTGRTDMGVTGRTKWRRGLLIASGVVVGALAIAVPVLWLGGGDQGEAAGASGETAAVTFSTGRFGVRPTTSVITASGDAVNRGIVCHQLLAYSGPRYQTLTGAEIDDSDWIAMFDAAMDAGTVFEVIEYHTWSCADGTGALEMTYEARFDLSEPDLTGQLAAGTWRFTGGTDAYSELTGSGDVVVDFDRDSLGRVVFSGEITTG